GDVRIGLGRHRRCGRLSNPARTRNHRHPPPETCPMSVSDDDYDADDAFDDIEDASVETLVWQLLQLINPGDEDTALQQFDDYRETVASMAEDSYEPVHMVAHVIDWRSGFHIDVGDSRALVQVIDELCARWNLAIDWNG